tara:strand:+ start:467 stop:685 length:219 start_codon:yes stop_codon:yes gene_type:complete
MKIEICDEQVDRIVVDFLKYHIGCCERTDDPHETNDNKAHLLSALYRTLEYCTTQGEYREFVEGLKNDREGV